MLIIFSYDHSKKKGIRHLVIRGLDGQYQCTLVTGEDYFPESLSEDLMKIKGLKSLYQSIQTTKNTPNIFGKKMIHLGGAKYIEFRLDEIVMRLSVQSFFQLNTTQAKTMYRLVKEMVPMNCDWILEGYSGIGGISLYLKDHAKEITGVEYIESAVRNANENAKRNHADHVHFVAGDAAEVMTRMLKKRTPDVIVVDPPRAGLDDAMLETLLRSKAKRIIYISCNPSTLAKNLAVLQNRYQVKRMVPLDMFSQTQHVESITLLQRK